VREIVRNIAQFCGMMSVAFGLIYVIFNPGTLPFTIGFSISETKGIAMFGLIGTVLIGGYRMVRRFWTPNVESVNQLKGGV